MTNEAINFEPIYKQTMLSDWGNDTPEVSYLQDSYNPEPVPVITFSIEYMA